MCLIIFAHRADPAYPLVLAANRDEFFGRATAHAQFWQPDYPHILAGRDLVAGGTWLGISRTGRFAAVTNIRDPSQPERKARSRGELTLNFLNSKESAQQYCEGLREHFDEFAGFNLLVSDGETLCYVNNFENLLEELRPGVYGLSNGLLNSPWPKVERGRECLQQLIQADSPLPTDSLINMMRDRQRAQDSNLPATGIPLQLERELSATFISNERREYGTRCSTALLMQAGGLFQFSEQSYDDEGQPTSAHFYEFAQAEPIYNT